MSGSAAVSNAVVEGCSGALGSVIALLATYPLKTIYTLQALSTGDANVAPPEPTSRLLVLARFLQQYKLSTLYAGLGPNIVESALSSGVYFFFYSKLRDQAVAWSKRAGGAGGETRSKDIGVLASLLVATVAGACNQLITMPTSVVATRIQGYQSLAGSGAAKRRAPTTWETISSVFREDGLAGFWKGLLPSMILLANPAVQYMLFEKIKALMKYWKAQRLARARAGTAAAAAAAGATVAVPQAAMPVEGHTQPGELITRRCSADSDEAMDSAAAATTAAAPKATAAAPPPPLPAAAAASVQLSAAEVFLAGALAKIGATVATYPLIVVKARLQASSAAAAKAGGAGVYHSSTWGVISDTARHEGLGGFFKGLRAKILQTALNAALMLTLKEQLHGVTKAALTNCTSCAPSPAGVVAMAPKAPSAAG